MNVCASALAQVHARAHMHMHAGLSSPLCLSRVGLKQTGVEGHVQRDRLACHSSGM